MSSPDRSFSGKRFLKHWVASGVLLAASGAPILAASWHDGSSYDHKLTVAGQNFEKQNPRQVSIADAEAATVTLNKAAELVQDVAETQQWDKFPQAGQAFTS